MRYSVNHIRELSLLVVRGDTRARVFLINFVKSKRRGLFDNELLFRAFLKDTPPTNPKLLALYWCGRYIYKFRNLDYRGCYHISRVLLSENFEIGLR